MTQPGRQYNSPNYRYGFNGKEKDNKGEFGNPHYNFGARIYDPTLGKFLSVDPKWSDFAGVSHYNFAGNSPILFIDMNGEHPVIARIARNFSIAAVTDIMIQASINWLLSDNNDVGQAFLEVDYLDAAVNGATNLIKLGKKGKIVLNGGYAVVKGYVEKGENYSPTDALIDFLIGGGASALGDKLTSIVGNKGSTYLYKVFKNRGLKAGQIRSILQKAGFGKDVWNWEGSNLISVGAAREMRGNLIEDWVGSTVYTLKAGFRQTAYANRLVDFVSDNLSVSIKSVRNMNSSWKSSMKKHIDKLSGINGNARLDIRYNVDGGDQSIINELTEYGEKKGVEVITNVFD